VRGASPIWFVKSLKMHDRHSVTSCRVTDPAGNSPKSNTSFGAFAFDAFDAFVALDACAFAAALAFDADFAFDGADFLLAATPCLAFDGAVFLPAAPAFAFPAEGLAFFAAASALLLAAGIS